MYTSRLSKHIISPTQLNGFESETILASAYGAGNKKKLTINTYVTSSSELVTCAKVINQDKLVYQGDSLKEAIEEYNKY